MSASRARGISHERRGSIRFPLQLDAQCAFYRNRAPVTIQCRGMIQNLSAGGCCLDLTERARVDVGMNAHLHIDWPAKFQNTIPMQFRTFGHVLRVDGCRIVTTIRSYEFRLRGSRRTALASI